MNAAGPLRDLTLALVGPGRVGTSLASWAAAAGARVAAVGTSPSGQGGELARALGAEAVPAAGLASAGLDLLLVAVPDPALAGVAADLGRRPQAAVALHTSGSRDASALAPLRAGGTAVGSLHPLLGFPEPRRDAETARGVVFGLDGDPPAAALARRLAESWGGLPVEVPPAARPLYHLAAGLSAGGIVTLLSLAHELAARLGLPPEVNRGYLAAAQSALAAVAAASHPANALTGPASRGDAETLLPQLEALAALAPEAHDLVTALARETLRQWERAGKLTAEQRSLLEELPHPDPSLRSG